MSRMGVPHDKNKQKNADNLEEIKGALKKPHWSNWAMLLMTAIILLLTVWMAYNQYKQYSLNLENQSQSEQK